MISMLRFKYVDIIEYKMSSTSIFNKHLPCTEYVQWSKHKTNQEASHMWGNWITQIIFSTKPFYFFNTLFWKLCCFSSVMLIYPLSRIYNWKMNYKNRSAIKLEGVQVSRGDEDPKRLRNAESMLGILKSFYISHWFLKLGYSKNS